MTREQERAEAAELARISAELEALPESSPRRPALERELQGVRNRFVKANLRLAVKIAAQYHDGRGPLADLVQEGNLGLIRAIERFDPERGVRFCTYAAWWIRHRVSRSLQNHGRAVRVPAHLAQVASKMARLRRQFETRHDRSPELEELAELAGVTVDRARLALRATARGLSLEGATERDEGRSFAETLTDDSHSAMQTLATQRLREVVQKALAGLPAIEADILRKRFTFDVDDAPTLRELGLEHDLSRERIRQLQNRALERLRASLAAWQFEAA